MAIPTSVESWMAMYRIHTSVALWGVEEVKAPNFPDSVTEGDAKCVTTFPFFAISCLNHPKSPR